MAKPKETKKPAAPPPRPPQETLSGAKAPASRQRDAGADTASRGR